MARIWSSVLIAVATVENYLISVSGSSLVSDRARLRSPITLQKQVEHHDNDHNDHTLRELSTTRLDIPSIGDPSCPCLSAEQALVQGGPLVIDGTYNQVRNTTDLFSYGVQCGYHDITSPVCVSSCDTGSNLVECDRSWCQHAWCWVNPNNCALDLSQDPWFTNSTRYFSYATCRYPDTFKRDFSKLFHQTLRIGVYENTGGWNGVYRIDKNCSGLLLEHWTGPMIEFIKSVAHIGNIQLELKTPEDFLVNKSQAFWRSNSNFDLCVYATTLGLLDMCIGSYTVTEQRSTVSDWAILTTQDLYVITKPNDDNSEWNQFIDNVATIFQPFRPEVWLLVILFVLPSMGMLMVLHERGKPGSAFPIMETVLEISEEVDGDCEVLQRNIPLYEQFVKGIYGVFLAVMQFEYAQSVVTMGAKLTLLGITFFILTFLAVYTANLAAILTIKHTTTPIADVHDVVGFGRKVCASRKHMQIVATLYRLNPDQFVVDPIELGGDGQPGFDCPDCSARQRVFDFLDPRLADAGGKQYCHAAIAPIEDLFSLQGVGRHCDKVAIGEVLVRADIGFPVFEKRSKELIALFAEVKNSGEYEKVLAKFRPSLQCASFPKAQSVPTLSLGIVELTGIWIVSFGLALLGLCVTCVKWQFLEKRQKTHVPIHGYDQRGKRVSLLKKKYSGIVCENTGRLILSDSVHLENRSTLNRTSTMKSSRYWGRKTSDEDLQPTKAYDATKVRFVSYDDSSDDDSKCLASFAQNSVNPCLLDHSGMSETEIGESNRTREALSLQESMYGKHSENLDFPVLALNMKGRSTRSFVLRKTKNSLRKIFSQNRSRSIQGCGGLDIFSSIVVAGSLDASHHSIHSSSEIAGCKSKDESCGKSQDSSCSSSAREKTL